MILIIQETVNDQERLFETAGNFGLNFILQTVML